MKGGGPIKKQGCSLPWNSKGCRLQEKRRHEQICRVLCDVVTEELRGQPAFGQAAHSSETWVLLLEPVNNTNVDEETKSQT